MRKPKVEIVGERDGCLIRAITDDAGSHVVISGNKRLLSEEQDDHESAVALGRRILDEGLQAVPLRPPFGFFDFVAAMARHR